MSMRLDPPAGSALLERDAELAAIAEHVAAAGSGGGRLVAIEGGAGMGKTRLAAEARAEAADAGFEVLAARGGELEQEFSFGVVRQLFEPLLAGASPADRAALLAGAAGLARPLFDAAPQAAADAGDTSFAMLHGLYWLTANLAQRGPVAVAVDDLHWADPPSLRWIAYLARRLEGLPILVVVASRPPEQGADPTLVTEVLANAAASVRPRPLGKEAIAELAAAAFDAAPDAAFVDACVRATGGNPLFLQALLDTLRRELDAPDAAAAPRALETGPETVSRSIALRLARLPAEATALVRAASVLGDGAHLRLVADLASLDVEVAARTATALVSWELLRREDPVEFVHPIVRTVVYDAVSADERTRAHRRAGELLVTSGAPAEQAAGHLVLTLPGGDPFVARVLRLAAQRSLAQGAPQAARAYLRRALDEPPAPAERAELLRALGVAELHVDAYAAAEHLEQAIELTEDPVRRAEIALEYFLAVEYVDRFDLGAVAIEAALAGLGAQKPELRQLLEAALLECTFWDPRLTHAGRERVAALRDENLGDGLGANAIRGLLALHEACLGESRERSVALAERALAEGLRLEAFIPNLSACMTLTFAGELATARRLYAAAETEVRRRGNVVDLLPILLLRAYNSLQAGDLRAAEEDLRSPELEFDQPGTTTASYRVGFLVDLLLERGDLADAERVLGSVRSDEQVHAGYRPFYLLARGRFAAVTGDARNALAELTALAEYAESLDLRNPAYVPWRSCAALSLRLVGRDAEARRLAREELELARRWGAPRPVGIALRTTGLVDGGPAGEELLREAVAVLEQSPARLEHARALVDLGATLRRRNERSEAREHLRQGLELAYRCGATALVGRAQEELVTAGARPRRVMLSGVDALTASERRVARMAADGMSNREIAQSLFVTVKAVEVHLSNTYRKLAIGSRTQLAHALDETAAAAL